MPNCRYLNDVIYVRDKFEFRYELDFFIHYFDHRYFHKKKFYDRTDTTRWVAQRVMKLVGNTKYRHTDFNKVVDSVAGMMPYYPVTEYLDTVITQLNLEYLATGEIKIKHKKTRQRSIIARIKPTELKEDSMGVFTGSLGNIKFYTSNKRHIIEQLDASAFDSLLIKDTLKMEEQALTDSLNAIIAMKNVQDSAVRVQDSLVSLRDSFAVSASVRDSIHSLLDAAIWSDEADSTNMNAMDRMDRSGNVAADPISMTNLDQMIRYVEWQKQNKGKENDSTAIKMPDLPGGVAPPVSSTPTTQKPLTPTSSSPSASQESSPAAEVAEEETSSKKAKKSRKKKEQAEAVENLINSDVDSQPIESAPVSTPTPSVEEPSSTSEESVSDSDSAEEEKSKKERKKKKKKKNSEAEDSDVEDAFSEDGF